MVPTTHYLVLSAILFAIGLVGVLTRRNVITMFMCIELMLNAVNVTFLAFSRYLDQMEGQIFVFFVMTVAAAEAAVGLALTVVLARRKQTVDIDQVNEMKW